MTNEERFEAFGDFDPSKYDAETHEKWGNSSAYTESARRTKAYTKADWVTLRAESDLIFADLAKLAEAGLPPSSAAAQQVAERHRLHIDRWFYPCPKAIHRGLGELYVNDPRFAANLDRVQAGLAAYAREAWRANSDAT